MKLKTNKLIMAYAGFTVLVFDRDFFQQTDRIINNNGVELYLKSNAEIESIYNKYKYKAEIIKGNWQDIHLNDEFKLASFLMGEYSNPEDIIKLYFE